MLAAAVVASTAGTNASASRLALIGLLALSMGGQNATARRLAVPDLTTTVLTLTVTGLVADTTPSSVRARRLVAILSMLIGALVGGILLRWAFPSRAALAGRRVAARLRRHGSHGRQPGRRADVALAPPPSQLLTRSVS